MATTTNQQALPIEKNAADAPDNSVIGGSPWKVSAGAAALAMTVLLSVMRLYMQLLAKEALQKSMMISAQADSAKVQAAATIEAGAQEKNGLIAAGSMSIVGGAASIVASLYPYGKDYNDASKKASDASTQLDKLKTLENPTKTVTPDASTIEMTTKAATGSDKAALIEKMKAGDFSDPASSSTLQALKTQPNEVDAGTDAYNAQKDDNKAYADIKTALDEKINTQLKVQTVNQEKMNNISMQRQPWINASSQVFPGIGNVVMGTTKSKQAEQTATSQVFQVEGSMAGANVQSAGDGMSKSKDAALAVVSTIKEMVAAGKVSG